MKPVLPLLAVLAASSLTGAEIEGAAKVIADLSASAEKPEAGKETGLAAQLEAYAATAPTLAPAEAASGWVELFKAWWSAEPEQTHSYEQERKAGFRGLVEALPPPAAWNALRAEMDQRPAADALTDNLLVLFGATLQDDPKAQYAALEAVRSIFSGQPAASPLTDRIRSLYGPRFASAMGNSTTHLSQALQQVASDPAAIRSLVESQIAAAAELPDEYPKTLRIPSIAALGGEEKARALVTKALDAGVTLYAGDGKTRALLRSVMLAEPERIKEPQWELVAGVSSEDIALYDLLKKRFPKGGRNPDAMQRAATNVFLAWVLEGKTKEASAWLAEAGGGSEIDFSHDTIRDILARGDGGVLLDFFLAELKKNPSLPIWKETIFVAVHEDRTREVLEQARAAAADAATAGPSRLAVLDILSTAALADGSVDEAIPLLREQIALTGSETDEATRRTMTLAQKLAELGNLLGRENVRNEGIEKTLEIAREKSAASSLGDSFLELLIASGRAADAQSLILTSMRSQLGDRYPGSPPVQFPMELTNLAGLYDAAGKTDQVAVLLAEAPWWGAPDLMRVAGMTDFRGTPLGELAARAVSAGGDTARAVEILKETIRSNPSRDSSYRMLVDLEGAKAMPFLDRQFAGDPFQERPLIWKAMLQIGSNDLAGAEKTIRTAISIDPSDGEMGAGDRMRAYAVLADILEKTGRADEAKIYRGAVEAVRLSENADRYQEAGLLSQAIAMYRQALTYFSDAYCIQSRLAVQLADRGDTKAAEEHYRRAYELMPDSFGRMESHCFGCERAFKGEMAETLAEKTFRKMIEDNPKKPQLYYLMGYLREEQGREEDALTFFRKAVELDPDYLNAWKKILSLNDILVPRSQRNEAAFAILRLQPQTLPGAAREVTDLARLWTTVAELRQKYPPHEPAPLMPLAASAAAIRKFESAGPAGFFDSHLDEDRGLPEPGEAVAGQVVVEAVSQLLTQLRQMRR